MYSFGRSLVENLLPGRAVWPKRSWESIGLVLLGGSLMFWGQLAADLFGILLILAGGGYFIYLCFEQQALGGLGRTRRRYQQMFSSLFVLGVFGFAAVELFVHNRTVLTTKLEIQNIEPHSVISGRRIAVNIYMRFSKIFKERMEKGDKKLSALVGNPFYVTVLGPKPTEQQVEALKGQRAAIFVAGLIQWSDRAGQHAYELCYFTQFDPRVVFMCREHNGSVAG